MKKKRLKGLVAGLLAVLFMLTSTGVFAAASTTLGDVSGDGKVNSADAILLLRHTLFPSKYAIKQSGDFNGDGTVNSADARTVLLTSYND